MLFLVFSAVLIVVLFLLPYYWFNLSRRARLISHIPGPKPYPLVGNALKFGYKPSEITINYINYFLKCGFLSRYWLGPYLYILVNDPKYAEHFFSSNNCITKSREYEYIKPWLGTGLLTSTGSKWRHHRKILTPTFHFKILEEFMDVFSSNGKVLIQKLQNEAGGTEFDIHDYITLCALDIICETAMGVVMNVQNDANSPYVTAIHGLGIIVMTRTFSPWLFPDFIFNMTRMGKKQKEYLKVLHDTTNKVIASRKKELFEKEKGNMNTEADGDNIGQKKRFAFLDLLLQYNKEGGNLTDEEIREEVDTFMFEGHDTISSAISFCLWSLSQHPQYQDEVYQELQEIFGNSERDATTNDLQNMKYLERVIKESLRLYPSVPIFARKLDEEVNIDGLHLFKGTNVAVAPYIMHRNPMYFPDPEKFDPERFSPDNVQGRHPYAYVPFSAGPRNCIGQKFAMMEMKCIISKVLRNFVLIPSSRKISVTSELVLRSSTGIYIKLEKR